MSTRSEQLQIRVTPREKSTLRRLARRAGLDLSSYVLNRALPSPARLSFAALIRDLARGRNRKFALAELNELLAGLAPGGLREATEHVDLGDCPDFERNYVAAMVEHASATKRVEPPTWVRDIAPLEAPWFATSLKSLRLHLLRSSPVAFRRRNLFVDSSVGDRV